MREYFVRKERIGRQTWRRRANGKGRPEKAGDRPKRDRSNSAARKSFRRRE